MSQKQYKAFCDCSRYCELQDPEDAQVRSCHKDLTKDINERSPNELSEGAWAVSQADTGCLVDYNNFSQTSIDSLKKQAKCNQSDVMQLLRETCILIGNNIIYEGVTPQIPPNESPAGERTLPQIALRVIFTRAKGRKENRQKRADKKRKQKEMNMVSKAERKLGPQEDLNIWSEGQLRAAQEYQGLPPQ